MTPAADAKVGREREQPAAQRVDKWLWQARIYKTRSLAAKAVAGGSVRVTRDGSTSRIEKASAMVRPGDSLAFLLGDRLCVLEILACGLRRGPASEARLLYMDRSPPKTMAPAPAAEREKGSGRPTKKDRRDIERLNETS